MIEAVSYRPEHLLALALQPAQRWMASSVTRAEAVALGESDHAIAVVDGDRVLAVAGVYVYWQNRGLLWSFLAEDLKKDFVAGHRLAKRFIESVGIRRLEAAVDCDFEQGHRWVRLLGFELETPRAKKFRVDGKDCSIYVKVSG